MTESAIILTALFACIAICAIARAWSEKPGKTIIHNTECKCDKPAPTTEKRL